MIYTILGRCSLYILPGRNLYSPRIKRYGCNCGPDPLTTLLPARARRPLNAAVNDFQTSNERVRRHHRGFRDVTTSLFTNCATNYRIVVTMARALSFPVFCSDPLDLVLIHSACLHSFCLVTNLSATFWFVLIHSAFLWLVLARSDSFCLFWLVLTHSASI